MSRKRGKLKTIEDIRKLRMEVTKDKDGVVTVRWVGAKK